MKISRNDIGTFLQIISETGAWNLRAVPDQAAPAYWIGTTTLKGAIRRNLEIYIGISHNCLCFQMPLVVYITPGCRQAVNHYLLRLAGEVKLIKFNVDRYGELYMSSEMLLETASMQAISTHLDAFQSYFEQYYREIEAIAHDYQLATLWKQVF